MNTVASKFHAFLNLGDLIVLSNRDNSRKTLEWLASRPCSICLLHRPISSGRSTWF
jgi:hypothetical protein